MRDDGASPLRSHRFEAVGHRVGESVRASSLAGDGAACCEAGNEPRAEADSSQLALPCDSLFDLRSPISSLVRDALAPS